MSSLTHSPRRTVSCPSCNDKREISSRQYRRILYEDASKLCNLCRQTPEPQIRERHRRFWLDRFTVEEIKLLSHDIWGTPL